MKGLVHLLYTVFLVDCDAATQKQHSQKQKQELLVDALWIYVFEQFPNFWYYVLM